MLAHHRRVTVIVTLILSACGGTSSEEPTGPTGPVVATVEITSGQQSFNAIGATQQFSAVPKTATGETVSGQSISWSSSDNAVVTVTAGGLATTAGNGSATITAAVGSVSDTASVTVQQEIAEITFSVDSVLLDRWGDTLRVSATAVDPEGTPVEAATVAWSSSDSGIADVDADGLITTWTAGEVEITGEVTVTPAPAPPRSESSRPATASLQESAVVPVRVAIQRNSACQVPTTYPVQPPVGVLPMWEEVADPLGGTDPGLAFSGAGGLAAGDFDGDGDDDLIVPANPPLGMGEIPNEARALFWQTVDGASLFEYATAAVLEPDSIRMESSPDNEIADFNSDGVVDLFRAQIGYDADPQPGAPNVLLLSQPDHTMLDVSATHIQPNEADGFTETAESGDVDCDGDLDLFTANIHGGAGTVPPLAHLYLNDGVGMLVADDQRIPDEIADGQFAVLKASFCDLDRDGDVDLIAGRFGSLNPEVDHELVLVNDGFGRFRRVPAQVPSSYYGSANDPQFIACVDVDLDGWPDVVVANLSVGSADTHVNVWLNRGDLVFEDVVLFQQRPETDANQLTGVFDVNGDGWVDIVRRTIPADDALLINAGGTAFTSQTPPTHEASFLDADGDGRLDVIWPAADAGGCACFQPRFWYQR